MVLRVRRCEDDHRAARPPHAPLPHRLDGQHELPLPAQIRCRQEANQGPRADSKGRQSRADGRCHLIGRGAGESATGYALRGFPRAHDHPSRRSTTRAKHYTYPQPIIKRSALPPRVKIGSAGRVKIRSAPTDRSQTAFKRPSKRRRSRHRNARSRSRIRRSRYRNGRSRGIEIRSRFGERYRMAFAATGLPSKSPANCPS